MGTHSIQFRHDYYLFSFLCFFTAAKWPLETASSVTLNEPNAFLFNGIFQTKLTLYALTDRIFPFLEQVQ